MDCSPIVASVEVNATKTVSINQPVQKVINSGDYIFVKPCLLVQNLITYAYSKRFTYILSKIDRDPIRGHAGPDPAFSEVVILCFLTSASSIGDILYYFVAGGTESSSKSVVFILFIATSIVFHSCYHMLYYERYGCSYPILHALHVCLC